MNERNLTIVFAVIVFAAVVAGFKYAATLSLVLYALLYLISYFLRRKSRLKRN
ncbi:hypothetical protein HH562_000017 [Salmonella enterica subsp. enterica serovar Yaba]|nr:hypothetical protein [Salmonella enterica subsp. enterica serovar Yaba]